MTEKKPREPYLIVVHTLQVVQEVPLSNYKDSKGKQFSPEEAAAAERFDPKEEKIQKVIDAVGVVDFEEVHVATHVSYVG